MKDPLLSPVYGDMAGFPPTILTSGTRDLLLSNTVRVHRKLRRLGDKAANVLGAPAVSSIPAQLPGSKPTSARKGREDDRAVLR